MDQQTISCLKDHLILSSHWSHTMFLKKEFFHPNLTTSTKDDPPPLKDCLVEKKLVVHVHIMGNEAII